MFNEFTVLKKPQILKVDCESLKNGYKISGLIEKLFLTHLSGSRIIKYEKLTFK